MCCRSCTAPQRCRIGGDRDIARDAYGTKGFDTDVFTDDVTLASIEQEEPRSRLDINKEDDAPRSFDGSHIQFYKSRSFQESLSFNRYRYSLGIEVSNISKSLGRISPRLNSFLLMLCAITTIMQAAYHATDGQRSPF